MSCPYQRQTAVRRLLVGHRRRRGPGSDGVAGLGDVQIQAGQDIQRQQQLFAEIAHRAGKLPQHAFLFPFFGQTGLPPAVSHVYRLQRLDEHRGPGVGDVMDDTRYSRPHFRLDQQYHTAVTLGDQGFLYHLLSLQPPQASFH